MKAFKVLFSAFFALALLISCGSKQDEQNQTPAEEIAKAAEETAAPAPGKKYEIKSGIVTYSTKVMGMDQKMTIYFDDYGALEATDTYMEVMGQKVHSRSFVKDGFAYSVDFVQKTATKTKMSGFPVGLAFANLSKDIEEKMNLKKLGKETINGYECEKMSFDYKEMSTKGTVWTYKGVALKQEVSAMGMEVKMEPVSFEEKQVDRAIFEVPADIKVTEHNVDLNKIGE